MKRDDALSIAERIINGERADTYGDASENFTRIANMWAEVLQVPVTAEQVALCMTLVKVGRLIESPAHEDSWVDAIGYIALGVEVATEESDL